MNTLSISPDTETMCGDKYINLDLIVFIKELMSSTIITNWYLVLSSKVLSIAF